VVSALVLAPPVLAALFFGTPYTEILVLLAGALCAWEWGRLVGSRGFGPAGLALAGTVLAVLLAGALGRDTLAGWLLLAGFAAVAGVAWQADRPRVGWFLLGLVYIAVPCFCFLWLRRHAGIGLEVIFWMLLIVWATDIGAFFAGRGIGGPKLAPNISPGKTWAGLAGGALAATLVGLLAGLVQGGAEAYLALAGLLLALVAQSGDLFESWVKRRFGVKDTSGLIPGHGGLLDRIDGLLPVSVVVAILVLLVEVSI